MGGNPCGSTDQVLDLCTPPEVCANLEENKREHLIKHTTEDGTNIIEKTVKRDKALFVACVDSIPGGSDSSTQREVAGKGVRSTIKNDGSLTGRPNAPSATDFSIDGHGGIQRRHQGQAGKEV